jgi:hypothetical protein
MENLIELSDKELCCVRVGLSKVPLMGRAREVMDIISKMDSELGKRGITTLKVDVPHGKEFRSHKEFKKNDELIFTTEHGKPF